MPQTIEVPDVGTLQFPDSMTDEEMASAIAANFPEAANKIPPERRASLDRTWHGMQTERKIREDRDAMLRKQRDQLKEVDYPAYIDAAQAAGSVVGGFGRTVGAIPEAIGIGAQALQEAVTGTAPPLEEFGTFKAGKAIREASERVSEVVPRADRGFLTGTAPEAMGAAGAFIVGGLAGKVAKLPALVVTALFGSAAGGTEGYEDAIMSGADATTAWESFLWNAGVGTSEVIPIAGILNRINRKTGGGLGRFIRQTLTETAEEAGQEVGQTLLSNTIAKELYDEERKYLASVGESGAAGGVTGFVMSLAASAVGARRAPGVSPALEQTAPLTAKAVSDIAQSAAPIVPPAEQPEMVSATGTQQPIAVASLETEPALTITEDLPKIETEAVREAPGMAEGLPPIETPIEQPKPVLKPSTAQGTPLVVEQPEAVSVQQELFDPDALAPEQQQNMGITPFPEADAMGQKFKGFIKKFFTKERGVGSEVFGAFERMAGEVHGAETGIRFALNDFRKALADVYQLGPVQRLGGGSARIPAAALEQINSVLTGQSDINALPEQLRPSVQAMRSEIDRLSQRLLDEGLVDSDLAAIVGNNMGTYMTRSYRIFDDPRHIEKIQPEVMNKAVAYIRDQMVRNNPGVTEQQVKSKVLDYLEDLRTGSLSASLGTGKLGSKDLSLFMKRKDIAPEIRALLGEYTDPAVNFARSTTKMARFIANQRFLNDVRRIGIGKFLFEQGQNPPGYNTAIAPEGSERMSPLNGLRTSREFAEAFKAFNEPTPPGGALFRSYMLLNGIAKSSKTVFSFMTQMRNAMSQPYFWLFSGHFNIAKTSDALKSVWTDIRNKPDSELRAYVKRLAELGVVRDTTVVGELRATLQEAGLRDADLEQGIAFTWARALKQVLVKGPQRAYQISDEFGKIVGFENEKQLVRRVHPDWSDAQVDTEAAERIRNQYPTYSRLPRAIQGFRRTPFGPFVAFAYESIRTSLHAINQARKEVFSGNATEAAIGAQRLAGQITALSLPFALSALSKMVNGISDDEEDDLRLFLPPWSKNSQMAYMGKEPRKLTFVNLSYGNPYSYLFDPIFTGISRAASEDTLTEATVKAFGEMLRPFTDEQLLAGALLKMRDDWKPTDTLGEKFDKGVTRVMEALEPGTLQRLRKRIVPAFTGQQPVFGRELDPKIEMAAELTGIRLEKFDFQQGLEFKMRENAKNESELESKFRLEMSRSGKATKEDVLKEYTDLEQRRFSSRADAYRMIRAGQRRGVSNADIKGILKRNQFSKADVDALMQGRYRPYEPSKEIAARAKDRGKDWPTEEIRSLQVDRKKLFLNQRPE